MHREDIHKLIIGIAATGVLAFANYRVGDNRTHDQITALIAAIGATFAALVVLGLTQRWVWRAVAVFIWVGGTGVTYWMLSGKSFGLIRYDQAVTRAIIRAALDCGSVLLIACLAKFLFDLVRGKNVRLFDWIDERTGLQEGDPDA
jgi:hypothetical protein